MAEPTPTSTYPAAKRPKNPLAGPYGHPFHPVMVTIPIGTWVASLVFDIVAKASNTHAGAYARGSALLIGIGIVGAVIAALLGVMDWLTIPTGTRARSTGLTHMLLNTTVLVLFVVDLLLRRHDGLNHVRNLPFLISIVALLLLSVSGWLGGKLAYRYGVRVATERDQTEGYR